MKKNQKGFTAIEFALLFVIVAIIGSVGWFVWNARKSSEKSIDSPGSVENSARPLAAKELTDKIESAEIPLEENSSSSVGGSGETGRSGSSSPVSNGTQTSMNKYTSKYDGFGFEYPTGYRQTIWSDSTESSAITISGTQNNVLVSYGSPVEVPKPSCKDSTTPKMYIHEVTKLNNTGAVRQLYLVQYSYSYPNELIKGASVTDWDGGTPVVGATNMCNYRPVFKSKKNTDVWFNISDTSDAYRSKALSMEEFVKKEDVKEAITILSSGKY